MESVASGWTEPGPEIYSTGGLSVHDGDIYAEGNTIVLVGHKLTESDLFADLVPLPDWVGKRIERIQRITGSRVVFSPGNALNHKEDAYLINFSDGTTGEMFAEGSVVVSVFEDEKAPDVDLLVKAGMLTEQQRQTREAEYTKQADLRTKATELAATRKELQQSLLTASGAEGQAIYAQIEDIETAQAAIESARDAAQWVWVGTVFNLSYMTAWKPDLVDLFDWRNEEHHFGRQVDRMEEPRGKTVAVVHLVFKPDNSHYPSNPVYVLRFTDGTYSAPFGLLNGLKATYPIESLANVGLITRKQLRDLADKITLVRDLEATEETKRRKLPELKKLLEQPHLGEVQTRRSLQQIADIEQP